jgi:hypothetical protein
MTAVAEGHGATAGLSQIADQEHPQALFVNSRS